MVRVRIERDIRAYFPDPELPEVSKMNDDKKAETKLVFVVLACIRFCSFVLSESCSGNQYESCSGEIKVSYTALLDYAMRESLLNKLSIDTSYGAFLHLMWYIHRLLSFQAMIVLVLSSIGLRLQRWHCKLTMVRNGYYPEVWSVKVRSYWSWVWLFHYAISWTMKMATNKG